MKRLVTDVTELSYTKEVLESECPVIAFFSSPCNRGLDTTYLVFRTLAEKYGKEVKFINLDSDKCFGIASRYRITDQQSFVFFKYGRAVRVLRGYQDEATLRHHLNKLIGPLLDELGVDYP